MRVLLAVCLLVSVAGSALAQEPPRQLVVPFESVTRDPQSYWLSEGSAVMLTDALLALSAPAITREDRVRAFERLRVPPVATLSHATVIRLGELLGAAEVVIGTFETTAAAGQQEIVVRARAIQLSTGQMRVNAVERGPVAQIFDVYDRLARQLVAGTRAAAPSLERQYPPGPAIEQYVKGLLAQAPATRLTFLRQALRLYPSFERVRIELWRHHTAEGDHQQALDAARAVAPTHRLSRLAQFLAGVSMMHLAQYDPAHDIFSRLNAARPDPALLNNLGIVQIRRTRVATGARAVSYLSNATQLDANDGDLFFNLGYAYWLDKDLKAATFWLREAVRRDPADHAAHYLLGVTLQAAGNAVEGARETELARRLSSDYAEWEARQPPAGSVPPGLERIKTDIDVPPTLRVDDAIVAAEQRDQRELAAFHLDAGRRAYVAERDMEAIASLRRAIYLSPYEGEAHTMLGRIYLRNGRVDDAINALLIAIWIDDRVETRVALAEAYIQVRDAAAAGEEIAAILEADPGNGQAARLRGMLESLAN